ncbi:MAG: phosphate ABC transporter substrate-binding protein [Acidobacteriota bacterium]
MRCFASTVRAAILLAVGLFFGAESAEALKVNGSSTVNPVVTRAAEILRQEQGLAIVVDTQGGSSGGIASVGDGRVDVGMSSRPLNDGDRERYPETDFRTVTIGLDAVALTVSKDVWESGLRSLTRDQVRGLYEGRIENWREVGGPDRRVVFFNKEPGRGTWEVFADWLYGDADEAPLVSLPEVSSNEEGRTKVGSTRGAVTQLSAAWADGERVFALALENEHGATVTPTDRNLDHGLYPLVRPLLVLTDGEPMAEARTLIDFLLSERGRRLVEESGYRAAEKATR